MGIVLFTLPVKMIAQTAITIVLKTYAKIDSLSMIDISQQEYYHLPYKDTLTFHFRKTNIDCYTIRYSVNKKIYWKQVWLNNGKVTIKAHLADTSNLIIDSVLNSPIFYNVRDYLKQSSKLSKDTAAHNAFMLEEIERYLETPRSIAIAADYIRFNQNSKANLLKLKLLLSRQKSDFSWFIFYEFGVKRIDKLLTIKSLKLANFQFTDRKGKATSIKLKDYNYYLLDFWFVGCVPCMQQHLEIESHQQTLASQRVKVIGICIDKDFVQWNRYLLKHGYEWDNYLQTGHLTLSDYLGIQAFPVYALLNSKGEILSTFNSLRDTLDKLKIN